MKKFSVIILTYNEEANLERCLKSVADWSDDIIVVDSYSTDATPAIAKKFGARIEQREFRNQADQFNWALDTIQIKNEWVLRLDADERLTPELAKEIAETLPGVPGDVSGFMMKRRVYFMGRWIRHGGYYPVWFLRLFRRARARSEAREMDEHIVLLNGRAERLRNDFIDDNRKGLFFWTEKHNQFSTREVEAVMRETGERAKLAGQAGRKRWAKQNIYYRTPKFMRSLLYFIFRYIFRGGFLDGTEGLIFHFLQGFWYRFLIDAKFYEAERNART